MILTHLPTAFGRDKQLLPRTWHLLEETSNESLVVSKAIHRSSVPECGAELKCLSENLQSLFVPHWSPSSREGHCAAYQPRNILDDATGRTHPKPGDCTEALGKVSRDMAIPYVRAIGETIMVISSRRGWKIVEGSSFGRLICQLHPVWRREWRWRAGSAGVCMAT